VNESGTIEVVDSIDQAQPVNFEHRLENFGVAVLAPRI
jgi:hypothetical protein